jgi:DNA-binding transcriptional MerR regulator
MEGPLSIGQLARATGVAPKTIRYYEQVGLLPAPRRSATGYRQYARRDVHRLLFMRRARALGLSLRSLKTLTAELDRAPGLSMRPRLQRLVTEHLHAVRQQIADCQLLEQQLEQVLQRLQTMPPTAPAEDCRCPESQAMPTAQWTPQPPPTHTSGGIDMHAHQTMESLTRLVTTSDAHSACGCGCGCGCGCSGELSLIQLLLPQPAAAAAGEEALSSKTTGDTL